MKMRKIIQKVSKLNIVTEPMRCVKRKTIEKENKSTKNSKVDKNSNEIQSIVTQNKRSKQKHQNKWKYGIIVKQKTKLQVKVKHRNERRRAKKAKNLYEKGIITRSVARQLIDKNMLDLDQEYLVVKQQPTTNRILNDDVLKLVFGYLCLKDRFRIQRTSKQFYEVVQEMLASQMALRIGNIADYYAQCRDRRHSTINANIEDAIAKKYFHRYFYMNDITTSKESLGQILWKCPNVRCLELHNFNIDVETVKWIKWHSPNIECLRLDEIKYDLTTRKWSQIGQSLGDRLIHLVLDACRIKNDITNFIQNLPLLEEFQLRKYGLPLAPLLKRLSCNIRCISLTECHKVNLEAVQVLVNNRQIARNLQSLDLQLPITCSEEDTIEIFGMICHNFTQLRQLYFYCHYFPKNIPELTRLKHLNNLELFFNRDCYFDWTLIESNQLTALRYLKIHGTFFTPKMLEPIGEKIPNLEHLCLTNWAFCCDCPSNQVPYIGAIDYDCPECDEKCCKSLLKLENLQQLSIEFLFSSDDIKPLILSLLSFEKLNTATLIWYPVNTSINSINFINEIVNYGIKMANKNKNQMIRLIFEKYVLTLIDASKKLPKNLIIRNIGTRCERLLFRDNRGFC